MKVKESRVKIELATTAGFCYGVNRAINLVDRLVKDHKKAATLGPLIHNKKVINDLKLKGIRIINDINELTKDEILIIRSHGVLKEVYEKTKGIEVVDATCTFVSKIHKIVDDSSKDGQTIIIAGDPNHPEVIAIKSYVNGKSFVVSNEKELKELINGEKLHNNKIVMVAQTTFLTEIWENIKKILKKECTNFQIYDTICIATEKRQREAQIMAKKCDYMLVVGDKLSSNTKKLLKTCEKYCQTNLVETADDLRNLKLKKNKKVGITAGASTPAVIIEEVCDIMDDIYKRLLGEDDTANEKIEDISLNSPAEEKEESFEKLLNDSTQQANLRMGAIVKGTVTSISENEVQVDLGRKQTGVIPISELTRLGDKAPDKVVKTDEVVEAVVIKKDDESGIATLSKKRADEIRGYEKMVEYMNNKTVLFGEIVSVVKGGVLALAGGIDVFIPLSHLSDIRVEDPNKMLGQEVEFRIIEADVERKKAVGSIRDVLDENKVDRENEIWGKIEIGQTYMGIVRTITDYGVFVDIGGIDGMVHVSDLSWSHVRHPSDILKVGDNVEVYIKDINDQTRKIALGYKKSEENPFEVFKEKYHVGDVVDVEITGLTDFGAFAKIMPEVEGLIHVSQISNDRIDKPSDRLKMGEKLKAKIVKIDNESRKIALSLKELIKDERKKEDEENKKAVDGLDGIQLS